MIDVDAVKLFIGKTILLDGARRYLLGVKVRGPSTYLVCAYNGSGNWFYLHSLDSISNICIDEENAKDISLFTEHNVTEEVWQKA